MENIITFSVEYRDIMESIKNALNTGKYSKEYIFSVQSKSDNEVTLLVQPLDEIHSITEFLKDVGNMKSFAKGFWLSFMEYGGAEF